MQQEQDGQVEKELVETVITASFTGKISTGQFENSAPFFSFSEKYNRKFSDEELQSRQKQLHEMCYTQFKLHAEIAYNERIAKTYQNIRFYEGANGLKYPSVTSILNMDENFFTSPEELAQYAARGTVIHKQVEIFLQTGEWKEPKDIPDVASCYMTVVKGSLGLLLDDVDFRTFYKDYPFKVISQESQVINHEFRFGGRLDIKCVIESTNKGKWEKIEGIKFDTPTILDIKTGTTLDKQKGLTQQAAYAKTDDTVTQIGLIHLNKENVCGYGKPAITSNIEPYWNLFINKRELFKNRYAI